jgi:hypothetical protein
MNFFQVKISLLDHFQVDLMTRYKNQSWFWEDLMLFFLQRVKNVHKHLIIKNKKKKDDEVDYWWHWKFSLLYVNRIPLRLSIVIIYPCVCSISKE